jgi:cytochrome c553
MAGLLLCAAAACGQGNATTIPSSPAAALYAAEGCADCHGADGTGGTLGPALAQLRAHWTADELAAYLADPRPALAGDERLGRLGQPYIMSMPDFRRLDQAKRLLLAEHLLATYP